MGTHTHVPTADTRILPGGTAYQTDVGMTGPYNLAIRHFLTGMPIRLEGTKGGPELRAVVVTVDEAAGKPAAIRRYAVC